MNDLFDQMTRIYYGDLTSECGFVRPTNSQTKSCFLDETVVYEEDKVHLSVPGMSKEDIKLEVSIGTLLVTGTKENGRFTSSFTKSLSISDMVDLDSVSARCENGVLTVHLPLLKNQDTKRIIEVK